MPEIRFLLTPFLYRIQEWVRKNRKNNLDGWNRFQLGSVVEMPFSIRREVWVISRWTKRKSPRGFCSAVAGKRSYRKRLSCRGKNAGTQAMRAGGSRRELLIRGNQSAGGNCCTTIPRRKRIEFDSFAGRETLRHSKAIAHHSHLT